MKCFIPTRADHLFSLEPFIVNAVFQQQNSHRNHSSNMKLAFNSLAKSLISDNMHTKPP